MNIFRKSFVRAERPIGCSMGSLLGVAACQSWSNYRRLRVLPGFDGCGWDTATSSWGYELDRVVLPSLAGASAYGQGHLLPGVQEGETLRQMQHDAAHRPGHGGAQLQQPFPKRAGLSPGTIGVGGLQA
jgi:hypothetical protein